MHGDLTLGGPLWVAATALLVIVYVLALFVLIDGLRRVRQGARPGRGRIALWVYAIAEAAFLIVLVIAQVLPGVSLMSAAPVLGAPLALAIGIAYLLHIVFPRGRTAARAAEAPEVPEALEAPGEPVEPAE